MGWSTRLTCSTFVLFGRHDQSRIAREVVCVLLVGDCGIGDRVEALEERGDAGFERAVFGHGGYVLMSHFFFGLFSSYY